MESCPCGSGKDYPDCCEPLISGAERAKTAEKLMRSRYTAYVNTAVDYLYDTIHPDHRADFNPQETRAWSKKADWQSLEILATEAGGEADDTGVVEFVARYRTKGVLSKHHEIAEFVRQDDRWYFKDGKTPDVTQVVRQGTKIGRNDPCPCGSGKKYKKCCGR